VAFMRRFLPALIALFALAGAHTASAASTEIGIADDRMLLPGGPTADQAVAEWRRLGVDNVRILAKWSQVAPAARPSADPADPAMPGYQWFYLDGAVRRVRAAGMSVTLTITGPGPVWASSSPSRHNGAYRPRPSAYADFATAVARRYGSLVDRYVLWNEPNISDWLTPQARCKRHRCTPIAPHLYRGLVRAAYPAVRRADPGSRVVIGALSPRGQRLRTASTVMRPLVFLRAFGCRTDRFKRLRTRECRRFKPATGDGFAIHPYSSHNAPERAHPNSDDVSLAQIGNLTRTLDRLQRRRAIRSTTHRFGIYIDEYGYQTNPPDRFSGIRPRRQDLYLQRAAYLAWRNSRIKLLTQYLWRDEPQSPNGWQSGLRFAGGRAKPSLNHFDTPFVLDAGRNRLWGQVRPGGSHVVTVQRRPRGASKWRRFATVHTDGRGYFRVSGHLVRGTSYRFRAAGQTSSARRR
jgi:hypothetical protein